MSIDTMDPNVLKANQLRNTEYVKMPGMSVIDPETQICGICQVKVGEMTKHCKACNKCVDCFDHHCVFLSTCIGKKNYVPFCIMIVCLCLIGILVSAVSSWVISTYFLEFEVFEEKGKFLFLTFDQMNIEGSNLVYSTEYRQSSSYLIWHNPQTLLRWHPSFYCFCSLSHRWPQPSQHFIWHCSMYVFGFWEWLLLNTLKPDGTLRKIAPCEEQ